MPLWPYKAVFRNRGKEVGLSETAIDKAITSNIGTLGQFGFSTNYIPGPGNVDEARYGLVRFSKAYYDFTFPT